MGTATPTRPMSSTRHEEWTNWDGLGLMQQIGAMPDE